MTRDRKMLYSISALIFAVLLSCLFIPGEVSGRIAAASILVPSCFVTHFFIKKRTTPSINKGTVLLILAVCALLYVMLYYLSGLKFGFFRAPRITAKVFFGNVIPTALIIVSVEVIRCIISAQRRTLPNVLIYLASLAADVLIFSRLAGIVRFSSFMELIGMHLFPAVTGNLLYGYIAKRYGALPNIVYRLIITLYSYFIPYGSAMPDAIIAFAKLFIPLILLVFTDVLFEKRKRFALKRKSKWRFAIYGVILAFMISTVMIISCQFKIGMIVIATESMTGEIDKGDAVVYETLDEGDVPEINDIIIFNKNKTKTVHRIIDIEKINGTTRYYTKGDANESADHGYITDSDIIGKVKFKIVYIGYPSLLLRELFKNK